jgi:xanthine dehydrogenase accessory factor
VTTGLHEIQARVLIKGAGELASASAHRLFRCGFQVVMIDLPRPTAVRRTVAFSTALEERAVEIEGVRGVAYSLSETGALERLTWDHIPVFPDPTCRLREIWRPAIIVDGRMLKRNEDNRIEDAELVVGLGPGLEAGKDVHLVVETHRGHNLGRIIARGTAAKDTGQPGEIGGYTHERVLTAPTPGIFTSSLEIGGFVHAGEIVGRVAAVEVRARIDGVMRGLLRSGLEVAERQKLGDIDPRNDRSFCFTLSDKARTISGSVLEIVVRHVAKGSATLS